MKNLSILVVLLFSVGLFLSGCQNENNPVENNFSGSTLTKVAKYNVPGDFTTIQEAVDAVTGKGIIYVHEDLYAEAVLIDGKDITLSAIGDVTIAPTSPTAHGDAITVYNGKVTIDGFKVDAINCTNGIYAAGGFPINTDPVVLDALNNHVSGYAKNGITVNGSSAFGNVVGNTVLGRGPVGPGSWAQNGIQFGYGSKGKAMDNYVKGDWYTGSDWGATGILIFETDDIMVQKNEIVDCEVGIAAQAWGWYLPSVNQNRIIQNTLNDCEWGISVSAYGFPGYSQMDAFAINNKVTNNYVKAAPGIGMTGIEVYAYDIDPIYTPTASNNKVISNTIEGYVIAVDEFGTVKSKIHANVY